MTKLTIDGYPACALHVPSAATARVQREQAMLDAAKPCPFCGSVELRVCWWATDDGDADAIECADCDAGAPFIAWQKRLETTGNNTK